MIVLNDFGREPTELRSAEEKAVAAVLNSGWYILGEEVAFFEAAWAKFCGARFCVGVANGMEAMQLGLHALGIGPGDEVITTPMTALATVLSIIHAGPMPVLADIDFSTALIARDSVARCISSRTRALLLVHLYGQVPNMADWAAFCADAGITLLEDCAQAHGARHNGQQAGTFGRWGAFSFYPTKNLGAKGDAGALVTDSEEVAVGVRQLRNYGMRSRYEHASAGFNSRLDELQAAILAVRLPWLDRFNSRREEIAARYRREIRNPRVELLAEPIQPENHVYHLFVVHCSERDRLADFLKHNGIQTLIHYPIPAHQQACCTGLRRDPAGLRNAEAHAQQCLSIPCHPQLTDDEVSEVIEALNRFK